MTETTETPVATMRYRWELRERNIDVPAVVNMRRAGGPLIHRTNCWEASRAEPGGWAPIDEVEVQAVFAVRRMMRRLEITPDEKRHYVVPGLCQQCCIEKVWKGRIRR